MRKIRLLVVDDSPFVCRLVTGYFQTEEDIEVVGQALTGRQAIERVKELHPDVITMDLEMPDIDGLAAVQIIMQQCPTPIVALSGVSGASAGRTLRALELGAVDFVLKFSPGVRIAPEQLRREIVAKVRAAAQTRVVRLRKRADLTKSLTSQAESRLGTGQPAESAAPVAAVPKSPFRQRSHDPASPEEHLAGVVVIGASTGGPPALRQLLTNLPADLPYCVLVVQHMPAVFTAVLASQLDEKCHMPVREAKEGDSLRSGRVYVAPGGSHMLVTPALTLTLQPNRGGSAYCPSIDVTMESAARVFGDRTKGIILTGMGDDGSRGLAAIHAAGGETYAQDRESSVIHSMPQKAVERSTVDYVAPPEQIANVLSRRAALARG